MEYVFGYKSKEHKAAMNKWDSLVVENKKVLNEADSMYKNFKEVEIGLQMKHKYRAKTLSGNLKLSEKIYVFNPEITTIIRSYDKDEREKQRISNKFNLWCKCGANHKNKKLIICIKDY